MTKVVDMAAGAPPSSKGKGPIRIRRPFNVQKNNLVPLTPPTTSPIPVLEAIQPIEHQTSNQASSSKPVKIKRPVFSGKREAQTTTSGQDPPASSDEPTSIPQAPKSSRKTRMHESNNNKSVRRIPTSKNDEFILTIAQKSTVEPAEAGIFYLDFGDEASLSENPLKETLSTSNVVVEDMLIGEQSPVIEATALLLPAHVFVPETLKADITNDNGALPREPSEPLDSGIQFVDDDSKPVCSEFAFTVENRAQSQFNRLDSATSNPNKSPRDDCVPSVGNQGISLGCAKLSLSVTHLDVSPDTMLIVTTLRLPSSVLDMWCS